MAHPLEVSYNWRTPVLFASLGAVVCVGVLARGQVRGWGSVLAVIVALWAGFVGLAYLRTRAYLLVDEDTLTVRRYRTLHTVAGRDVLAMTQFQTPNGPSYRLTVRSPHGRRQRLVAPVALLRRGHATLFGWILTHAPQAELDPGSRRTLSQLQERGLLT